MSILHGYINKYMDFMIISYGIMTKYMIYHDCYYIISPYIWLQNDSINLPNTMMTQLTNDWTQYQCEMMKQW